MQCLMIHVSVYLLQHGMVKRVLNLLVMTDSLKILQVPVCALVVRLGTVVITVLLIVKITRSVKLLLNVDVLLVKY